MTSMRTGPRNQGSEGCMAPQVPCQSHAPPRPHPCRTRPLLRLHHYEPSSGSEDRKGLRRQNPSVSEKHQLPDSPRGGSGWHCWALGHRTVPNRVDLSAVLAPSTEIENGVPSAEACGDQQNHPPRWLRSGTRQTHLPLAEACV